MPNSRAAPQKSTRPAKVKKPRRRALPVATTDAIFAAFEADNPEPKGELDYVNTFTLLVAVVLSAQATDIGVNRATASLFAIADTPDKMVALGEDTVREYIKTIGLYRNKAKNVIALSERLRDDFNGKVPADRDMLETPAGCWPQDCECCTQHCIRTTDHRRRHTFVSGFKPYGYGAWRYTAGRGTTIAKGDP